MRFKVFSKGILFDYQEVDLSTKNSVEFFKDANTSIEDFDSITTINESEIVNWLLEKNTVRNFIFEELKIPKTVKYQTEVIEPFIVNSNSKPGDIDILVCDPKNPLNSIAFECKRIKVKPETFFTGQISGLTKARYAVKQANELAKNFSFSKVYVLFIIQVNGEDRNEFNQLYRGSTDEHKERIYKLPFNESIISEIGVIFVEIIQVTNRTFDKNAYISLSIGRFATKRMQSSELTEKLEKYFK